MAPEELARHGLEDGVERLRGQLQDTVQGGQTDRCDDDQIEDVATSGVRQAEHRVERLLGEGKEKCSGSSVDVVPSELPASAKDIPAHLSVKQRPRVKTREAVRPSSVTPTQGQPTQTTSKPAVRTKGVYP